LFSAEWIDVVGEDALEKSRHVGGKTTVFNDKKQLAG
jgi:hypothetical protein